MEGLRIIPSEYVHVVIPPWKLACGMQCDLGKKTMSRWKLCSEAIGRRE